MNLINLTNHPSSLWSEKQREEALRLVDKIVDYAFPNVMPNSTEGEISILADKVFEDIVSSYGKDIIVHLMGEFTLCFALLKRFQKEGIVCVASCTERNVIEKDNGERITRFEFKRFRKYE